MTHERVEDALRAEIPLDEHRYVTRPIPATVEGARSELSASHGPSSIAMLVGAAAAAGLVAIVGWVVWNANGPSEGGVGSATSPTAVPSPSSPPPIVRSCTAEDVAVAGDPWGGAAGSRGTTVVVRVLDSTPACDLPAVVVARVVDASRATVVQGESDPTAGRRVERGTQLELGIAWSNWCDAEPAAPLTLELRLDESGTWIPVGDDGPLVPPCMGSGQPTNLSVTGFQPSERPPIEG